MRRRGAPAIRVSAQRSALGLTRSLTCAHTRFGFSVLMEYFRDQGSQPAIPIIVMKFSMPELLEFNSRGLEGELDHA